jgi:hypothetical protein
MKAQVFSTCESNIPTFINKRTNSGVVKDAPTLKISHKQITAIH